jgi:hypothetical protein
MASRAVLTGIVIMVFLVSCGCISGTQDNGVTARPTIDDTKWEQVVDHTYVLTAARDLDNATVPVDPNTAYHLKIIGEKPVELSLNPHEEDLENATDFYNIKYTMFASAVYSFEGVVRTDPYQKNLEVRWVHYAGNPKIAGTTQSVHVVLERYDGDPSIVPETTYEVSTWSPR